MAKASEIHWLEDERKKKSLPLYRLACATLVETQLWSLFIFFAWFKVLNHLMAFGIPESPDHRDPDDDSRTGHVCHDSAVGACGLLASAEYVAYGYADPTSLTCFFSFVTRLSFTFFSDRPFDGRNESNRVLGMFDPVMFAIHRLAASDQPADRHSHIRLGEGTHASRQVVLGQVAVRAAAC